MAAMTGADLSEPVDYYYEHLQSFGATRSTSVIDTEPAYRIHSKIFGNLLWGSASIVGIPGNVLVLLVILRFRDMHSVANIFIFNLALADLLFLCGTPIVIIQSMRGEWIFGEAMCKAFLSGNGVNQFASACFIGVLSFDRYLAVCHAIRSNRWRTQRYAIALSAGAWLTVIVEMIPLLKFANLIRIPFSGTRTCMLFWGSDATLLLLLDDNNATSVTFSLMHEMQLSSRLFTSYSFILSYLLPLICIWLFYANIIVSLWVRRAQLFGGGGNRRTTTKVTLMGLSIVIAYTVMWLPFWIVQWSIEMEAVWTHDHTLLMPISYGAYALQYINSAGNPFLYMFLTDSFRKKLFSWTNSSAPTVNGIEQATQLSAAAIRMRRSDGGGGRTKSYDCDGQQQAMMINNTSNGSIKDTDDYL